MALRERARYTYPAAQVCRRLRWRGPQRAVVAAPQGALLRTFQPELTDIQHQDLDLLNIPTSVYTPDP